jgi:hypothetical protein
MEKKIETALYLITFILSMLCLTFDKVDMAILALVIYIFHSMFWLKQEMWDRIQAEYKEESK